jgi:hypothetical protein
MIFSILILCTYIIQIFAESRNFKSKWANQVTNICSYLTFTLLGLVYFDILMVVLGELSSVDIAKDDMPIRIVMSYLVSLAMVVIVTLEVL